MKLWQNGLVFGVVNIVVLFIDYRYISWYLRDFTHVCIHEMGICLVCVFSRKILYIILLVRESHVWMSLLVAVFCATTEWLEQVFSLASIKIIALFLASHFIHFSKPKVSWSWALFWFNYKHTTTHYYTRAKAKKWLYGGTTSNT